jgi:hypothetical protein
VSLFSRQIDAALAVLLTLFVLITLVNCGALLEQRKWIYYLEFIRVYIFGITMSYVFNAPIISLTVLFGLIGIELFLPMKRWYLKFVYAH